MVRRILGHFLGSPEKYQPLRIPSAPGGSDFVVRRKKNAAGDIVTEIEWARPRYDLPGLRPGTVETGVSERGPKWRPFGDDGPEDGGSFLPPLPTPPAPPAAENLTPGLPPGGEERPPRPRPPAEAIERIEVVARELGVERASYAEDLKLGHQMNQVLARLAEHGLPLPTEILISRGRALRHPRWPASQPSSRSWRTTMPAS